MVSVLYFLLAIEITWASTLILDINEDVPISSFDQSENNHSP